MFNKNKLTKTIRKIRNIFSNIDHDVHVFQKKTALFCEDGCGQCCLSPRVEITALEMYPLVEYLIIKKQIEIWYKKAQEAFFEGQCIFYDPDAVFSGKGRCSIYSYRPSVCRLYGFSAFVNKMGRRSLVICSIIKSREKEKISRAQDRINNVLAVPVMKEYSDRLYQLHPVIGCRQMTINLAFKVAAESMSLYSQYNQRIKKKEIL